MARKPTPTNDYTPNPLLASPAADAFAAHCLRQLVLRGQLPQHWAFPDTDPARLRPHAHEGPESGEK